MSSKKRDHLVTELEFYRRQLDEMGSRLFRTHEELIRVYADAKRSRTTTNLIRRTYELINHKVSILQIYKRFLQVIVSTMSVDRAMIFRYSDQNEYFEPICILGARQDSGEVEGFSVPYELPEFKFINSRTEMDMEGNLLREIAASPYVIWCYNHHDKLALLIGNNTEDRIFRLPFSENDRDVVESSLSVFIDILKRKEAELAFRKSESRYRKLVESSPESIVVYCDGKILYANQTAMHLFGTEDIDDLIRKDLSEYIHEKHSTKTIEIINSIGAGRLESMPRETKFRRIDGQVIDVEFMAIPIEYHDEPAVQIVAIDISERKNMEREFIKVQKIESLGLLAGGIAHDFNNILTGILGNVELALEFTNPEREEYEFLKNAYTASNRAKELTHKLLTFSKGGIPLTEPTTLRDIITDSVSFILSGSSIICDFSFPQDIWPVDIDAVQFHQVIENLTINASQAMPNGGTLSISAENVNPEMRKRLPLSEKKYVKLVISDQGTGISEKDIQNIFDPYFTTKDGGTGLGLATTFSIIKKHKGLITVDSEINKGTTFTIFIPASDRKPVKGSSQPSSLRNGHGRILLMDDNETVRQVAVQMLNTLGFHVATASDGTEALEIYRDSIKKEDPFSCVIFDLTVRGGMGGEEAIGKLLEMDPEVRVIVSSGYSNNPVMSNFEKYGFKGIIRKPYNIRELSNCIFEVINKRR